MTIDDLFNDRMNIGENLLKLIRSNGFTKSSFSKRIGVTRPTLDSIIAGEINNIEKFKDYIERIKSALGVKENDLIERVSLQQNVRESFAFYNSPPEGYESEEKVKETFGMLDDILHLCSVYYKR